jgi:Zn-dependent protease
LSNTLSFLFAIPATLLAICIHEFSHAYVSYLLGDRKIKEEGRMSLNPLKHLDPIGAFCLVVFHFGWARPVKVDASAYKHRKIGFFLVSAAGPLSNFLVAAIAVLAEVGLSLFMGASIHKGFFVYLFLYVALVNIGMGVFNLIPVPPLDGSNMLFTILPSNLSKKIMLVSRYYPFLLFFVIYGLTYVFSTQIGSLDYAIYSWMIEKALRLFGIAITGNPIM